MAFSYSLVDNQRNPNILINGDMAIAQRGTSVATSSTARFSCDRWNCYRAAFATNQTVTQNTGSGLSGLPYFLRSQRTASDAATGALYVTQNIESAVARKYAGKNLTFSFWARAGANYSASSNAFGCSVASGTGTDESAAVGFTGASTVLSQSVTLTTSWQQFIYTISIPSTCNELSVQFSETPTGTAGANDYFDITGVMLNDGGLQAYRGAGNSFQDELAMCKRYYEIFQGFGSWPIDMSASTTQGSVYIPFTIQKRAAPTVIVGSNASTDSRYYGPAGLRGITSITASSNTTVTEMAVNVVLASAVTQYTGGAFMIVANNANDYIAADAEVY